MNILVDIGHPAHVHLLHPLAEELQRRGHRLHYSVRDIPVAIRLMEHYGMTPYLQLGHKHDGLKGKAMDVIHQDSELLRYVRKNHIDIGLSSGIVLSHVSQLTGMKAMMFDDDDDAAEPLVVRYGHPLSHTVFTPDCIRRRTHKAIYYPGTHELAYLHPNRFSADPTVLSRAGLHENERFFIMRFVALKGHHDFGQTGLTLEQKRLLVKSLEPHGRVIITSEYPVEEEFEQYRLPVPPEDIHSLMAYCSLFLGDSQTMTSEAAVLGVPALKCNTFAGRLSVPNMLEERFDLCRAFRPDQFHDMCHVINELLSLDAIALHEIWQSKRTKMLNTLSDPTEFFVNYIESAQ